MDGPSANAGFARGINIEIKRNKLIKTEFISFYLGHNMKYITEFYFRNYFRIISKLIKNSDSESIPGF